MTVICVCAPFEWSLNGLTEYAESAGVFNTFGVAERDRILRISSPRSRELSLGGLIALKALTDKFVAEEKGLEISRTGKGKPYFSGNNNFKFNISHSGELSVAALVTEGGQDVGVDIEAVDANRDFRKLAERFFNAEEREYLISCSYDKFAFYKLWTAKEARVKYCGEGLSSIIVSHGEPYEELFLTRFGVRYGGRDHIMTVCLPTFDEVVVAEPLGDIEIYRV